MDGRGEEFRRVLSNARLKWVSAMNNMAFNPVRERWCFVLVLFRGLNWRAFAAAAVIAALIGFQYLLLSH